jgi:hypothetical protein
VDSFFDLIKVNDNDEYSAQASLRVVRIGEALFLLRNAIGFDDLCRRFSQRDLRSTFYESYAAKLFLIAGYQVIFLPEIGVRGADFDFSSEANNVHINVEVTALTGLEFRPNTILNALEHKRGQVPRDAAAVIVCIIPETWPHIDDDNMHTEISSVISRFFRNTQRINVVLFVQEAHLKFNTDGSLGGYVIFERPFINMNARHKTKSLDAVWSRSISDDLRDYLLNPSAIRDSAKMAALRAETRSSEFFRWVDSLQSLGKSNA